MTLMRYLIPLPLIFFGVMFYVSNSVTEVPISLQASNPEKNQKKKRSKKDIIYRQKVRSTDPIVFVKKSYTEPEWDELRFENKWQEELFYLLKKLDPERGEEIFYSYLEEKKSHYQRSSENLEVAINGLSVLNGESGLEPEAEAGRAPASAKDPISLEVQHQKRIRNILGEHYEIIHEQEQLFQEENPEDLMI